MQNSLFMYSKKSQNSWAICDIVDLLTSLACTARKKIWKHWNCNEYLLMGRSESHICIVGISMIFHFHSTPSPNIHRRFNFRRFFLTVCPPGACLASTINLAVFFRWTFLMTSPHCRKLSGTERKKNKDGIIQGRSTLNKYLKNSVIWYGKFHWKVQNFQYLHSEHRQCTSKM